MTTELSNFAARLRERIPLLSDVAAEVTRLTLQNRQSAIGNRQLSEPPHVGCYKNEFNALALKLFALQFQHNAAYRKICEARSLTPGIVEHWTQIPAVPTSAFKELELTCLASAERTTVFHSSGTTEQKPSRHFHNAESLAVYEASLWSGFELHLLRSGDSLSASSEKRGQTVRARLVILTPPPTQAPHSSLVHMFETVRQKLGATETAFVGKLAADGSWTLDFAAVVDVLSSVCSDSRSSRGNEAQTDSEKRKVRASSRRLLRVPRAANPVHVLGTAFSFVHLLDFLAERNLRFDLPAGSRVMETGGYKNRSRSIPKTDLHKLITERLGVPPSRIICEYGMSELNSQAYNGIEAGVRPSPGAATLNMRAFPGLQESPGASPLLRPGRAHSGSSIFHFPPWARVQIISPETGREVADGETGLIRVYDLANVFSVMAIQTEDLGIRRNEHFELIGRAALAEARGCSLMAV